MTIAPECRIFRLRIPIISVVGFDISVFSTSLYHQFPILECILIYYTLICRTGDLIEDHAVVCFITCNNEDLILVIGFFKMPEVKDGSAQLVVLNIVPCADGFQCITGILCIRIICTLCIVLCDADNDVAVFTEESLTCQPFFTDCL